MEGRVIKIRELGDPILKEKSVKVNPSKLTDEDKQTIEDLKTTLEYVEGCAGISAVQIGVLKRIVIIRVNKKESTYRDSDDLPVTILINPEWNPIGTEMYSDYEACMSFPNVSAEVPRYKEVELTYYNEDGEKIKRRYKNMLARLVQHECDHLEGIFYTQRIADLSKITTKENRRRFKEIQDEI